MRDPNTIHRAIPRVCLALLAIGCAVVGAKEFAQAPTFDTSLLPAAAETVDGNPYRGHSSQAQVAQVGRSIYNQSCARCHGVDGTQLGPAPVLRQVGRFCLRVSDPAWRQRCQADADHYFIHSVEEGKVRVGVEHMPSWKSVLTPEAIWAVRTFLEMPPPLDAAKGIQPLQP